MFQFMFHRTFTPNQNATEISKYINRMYNLTENGEVKKLTVLNVQGIQTQTFLLKGLQIPIHFYEIQLGSRSIKRHFQQIGYILN